VMKGERKEMAKEKVVFVGFSEKIRDLCDYNEFQYQIDVIGHFEEDWEEDIEKISSAKLVVFFPTNSIYNIWRRYHELQNMITISDEIERISKDDPKVPVMNEKLRLHIHELNKDKEVSQFIRHVEKLSSKIIASIPPFQQFFVLFSPPKNDVSENNYDGFFENLLRFPKLKNNENCQGNHRLFQLLKSVKGYGDCVDLGTSFSSFPSAAKILNFDDTYSVYGLWYDSFAPRGEFDRTYQSPRAVVIEAVKGKKQFAFLPFPEGPRCLEHVLKLLKPVFEELNITGASHEIFTKMKNYIKRRWNIYKKEPGATFPILGTDIGSFSYFRRMIAASLSKNKHVLILGESGVGKELASDVLHGISNAQGAPHVKINCAGLSNELGESQLFGHIAGAFTGAQKDAPGS